MAFTESFSLLNIEVIMTRYHILDMSSTNLNADPCSSDFCLVISLSAYPQLFLRQYVGLQVTLPHLSSLNLVGLRPDGFNEFS